MVKEVRNIRRQVLPHGLTVITEQMEHIRSASIGIWLETGSRDETEVSGMCCASLDVQGDQVTTGVVVLMHLILRSTCWEFGPPALPAGSVAVPAHWPAKLPLVW